MRLLRLLVHKNFTTFFGKFQQFKQYFLFLKEDFILERLGKQTIKFSNPATILETASIVGPKESEGPMAKYFDQRLEDEFWGEKTWEKAESKIIKETVNTVISKSGIPASDIDYCFAGDLLNQCISSSFGLRELNIPFFRSFWSMFYICRKYVFRQYFCFIRCR